MTKQAKQRGIIVSILIISICLIALVGTSLAWFTLSNTNSGNLITSGSLDIAATWYDMDAEGQQTYEIDDETYAFASSGYDFASSTNKAMISDTDWQPGATNAKLITIKNEGTINAVITLDTVVQESSLQEALWFDFVMFNSDGDQVGEFEQRPMSSLTSLVSSLEFVLAAEEELTFILVYGMSELAGNEYQSLTYNLDIILIATQTEANIIKAYSISDIESATEGAVIFLMNNLQDTTVDLDFAFPINMSMNGYTLTVNSFTLYSEIDTTIFFENGTIIAAGGDISIQLPNGTINLSDEVLGTNNSIILDASTNTINLLGATKFLTIDESYEITTEKQTAKILSGTRVVVATDNAVSMVAQNEQGELQDDVTVEDANLGGKETLTDEVSSFEGTVVVASEIEFLNAIMKSDTLVLNSDLTINSSNTYATAVSSYYLVSFIQSYGITMNMNGNKFTIISPKYSIAIFEDKPLAFSNGELEVQLLDAETSYASASFMLYPNSEFTLTDTVYTTNGAGVLVAGPDATMNVINSSMTAPYYCVATNASMDSAGLIMNYTNSTFKTTGDAGIPVFLNVPAELTMTGCTVYSNYVGVLIRGGSAFISDTEIYCNMTDVYENYDEANGYLVDYYIARNWGSGTAVVGAGIVLGNRGGSSYNYDTYCSLSNVDVYLDGFECDKAVYVWGHSSEVADGMNDDGITLVFNYDDECSFDGDIYVGGSNVTINEVEVYGNTVYEDDYAVKYN